MQATLLLGLFFVGGTVFYTLRYPSPSYERLVGQLLGGENDKHHIIEERLSQLHKEGFPLSREFRTVAAVFAERGRWSFENKVPETTVPKIFVRALESNLSPQWKAHPLRLHALAEAYSMWAQAARSDQFLELDRDRSEIRKGKCIELYRTVAESKDPRATRLLKYSAIQNSGNAFLYAGDFSRAITLYKEAYELSGSIGSAGNLMAALIMVKPSRLDEAISLGEKEIDRAMRDGKALSESSAYTSLLSQMGFALLMKGDDIRGGEFLREAYDLEPDILNGLNLAVALALNDRKKDALLVLDRLKQPAVTPQNHLKLVKDLELPAYYLIRALCVPDESLSDRACLYLAYLGEPTTEDFFGRCSIDTNRDLLQKCSNELSRSAGPEKDLLLIPGFRAFVEGQGRQRKN